MTATATLEVDKADEAPYFLTAAECAALFLTEVCPARSTAVEAELATYRGSVPRRRGGPRSWVSRWPPRITRRVFDGERIGNVIDADLVERSRAEHEASCGLSRRAPYGWRTVLPPYCYRVLPPTLPRPLRFRHPDPKRDRGLKNPYMEWVAAEERQNRMSGGGLAPIGREGEIHRALYDGAGVPDGRCVCHYGAAIDKQAAHGRLCHACHDWFRENRGASREDRVVNIARARHDFDLRCFAREDEGYGRHEVPLRFDSDDEEDHPQKAVPYRGDFGGIGRGDDGGVDENPKLRQRTLAGTQRYKQTKKSENHWVGRWFGLRLEETRPQVRLRDGTIGHPLCTVLDDDHRIERLKTEGDVARFWAAKATQLAEAAKAKRVARAAARERRAAHLSPPKRDIAYERGNLRIVVKRRINLD
jgi:hypothetical protein